MNTPAKGSLDWYAIYAPSIIKMAETKIEHTKGKTRRRLVDAVERLRRLDDEQMRLRPDTNDPR